MSAAKTPEARVPQGSCLSRTQFLYYINDIPKNKNSELALFADDTAIIASPTNTRMGRTYTNRPISEITRYFRKWKLKINIEKCEVININMKLRLESNSNNQRNK